MELRDKNGLTEREYLAQYRADKYPRPSVTVDVCIFSRAADGALRTLLIRRAATPSSAGGRCRAALRSPGSAWRRPPPASWRRRRICAG